MPFVHIPNTYLISRYLFGAVSAHKYIIAFCIGVELLTAGTKRWLSILYIFTFSFMSALGIGVGILLVGGAGADAGLYSVILQVRFAMDDNFHRYVCLARKTLKVCCFRFI